MTQQIEHLKKDTRIDIETFAIVSSIHKVT